MNYIMTYVNAISIVPCYNQRYGRARSITPKRINHNTINGKNLAKAQTRNAGRIWDLERIWNNIGVVSMSLYFVVVLNRFRLLHLRHIKHSSELWETKLALGML